MTNSLKIQEVLLLNVAKGKGHWEQLMEAIKDASLAPKNWMNVRYELQELIEDDFIERTADVHSEEYVLSAGGKRKIGLAS